MRILLVTETFAPAADPVAESARHICDALIAAGHELLIFTTPVGSCPYRKPRVQRTRTRFPVPTSHARTPPIRPALTTAI